MRRLRIIVLLGILVAVGAVTYYQQTAVVAWSQPLRVEIYPIDVAGTPGVARYVARLDASVFNGIGEFLDREAKRYGVAQQPLLLIGLRPAVKSLPPAYPGPGAGALKVALWSLRLRYWAFRHATSSGFASTTVRLFVLYHPYQEGQALTHSLGLRKGLIGIVHAFGDERQDAQNNVVITHEFLHTLGAADRYDAQGFPLYPDGFADPDQQPLFPQRRAEIMGGRAAVSETDAVMPESLAACLIGPRTAREIRWLR